MPTPPPAAVRDPELSLFHRLFDKLFPAIRFTYESVMGHVWFTQVTPDLWLGGAPTYARDYQTILSHGIRAVLDVRAERSGDEDFYREHDIAYVRYLVPDVAVPDPETITSAADWCAERIAEGRPVLFHCAKGRGRSATLLAGYLMRERGMSFDEARRLLKSKRALTKLEDRHEQVLEAWIRTQAKPAAAG
jgi:hypothetical protein